MRGLALEGERLRQGEREDVFVDEFVDLRALLAGEVGAGGEERVGVQGGGGVAGAVGDGGFDFDVGGGGGEEEEGEEGCEGGGGEEHVFFFFFFLLLLGAVLSSSCQTKTFLVLFSSVSVLCYLLLTYSYSRCFAGILLLWREKEGRRRRNRNQESEKKKSSFPFHITRRTNNSQVKRSQKQWGTINRLFFTIPRTKPNCELRKEVNKERKPPSRKIRQ